MKSKNLLFIGAHPDDHLIAAGTMKFFANRGYTLHEIIMSNGESGSFHQNEFSKKRATQSLVHTRRKEYEHAAKLLGIATSIFLGAPDGAITIQENSMHRIVETLRTLRPLIVITHTEIDTHPDHEATAQIVLRSVQLAATSAQTTKQSAAFRVPLLLKAEGYLPHNDQIYFDTTPYQTLKKKLFANYHSQQHRRMVQYIESSDKRNGVAIHTEYAESFSIDPRWPGVLSSIF